MITSVPLISSAAGIPANRSALPAGSGEPTIRVTSGRKCIASYENSGRDGSFARTLLATLSSASTPYSLTWTLRDTPQQRLLFRLVPSGRLIGGTEYGLLPTPLACQQGIIRGRKCSNLLVNYLPLRFGGSYPNPSLLEAMMGFPTGWSEPKLLAMQSSRKFRKSSGGPSLNTRAN